MKVKDLIWAGILLVFGVFLIIPETREVFETTTKNHPYIMGFIKVGILATMGELLAIRISKGDFEKPIGLLWRFVVWGLFGVAFAIVFKIFGGGTIYAIDKGLLPTFSNNTLNIVFVAFITSFFMNTIFAPTFMALHRILDTYIEKGNGKLASIVKVDIKDVCNSIDWTGYVSFVVLKTIPIFWIPAHTITFLLREEYRVLMAAGLSIALGAILASAKKRK